VSNPAVDIHIIESFTIDTALFKRHMAIEQHAVHQIRQPRHGVKRVYNITIAGADLEAVHGLPMVAPTPGEDARPYGLLCGEKAKHVVDGLIWEGADQVQPAVRGGYLVPAPRRHTVEQAAGVALHKCRTAKSMEKYKVKRGTMYVTQKTISASSRLLTFRQL
jgi:hypothetical protein